jgi:hypothetical protein
MVFVVCVRVYVCVRLGDDRRLTTHWSRGRVAPPHRQPKRDHKPQNQQHRTTPQISPIRTLFQAKNVFSLYPEKQRDNTVIVS